MSPDTDVFIQKEALAQEHFFHRTTPVAASDRSFGEYRLMTRGLNTATQRLQACTLLNRDSSTGVFLLNLLYFLENFTTKHLWVTVSFQSSSHEPIFSIASVSPVEHDVGSTSQEAKSYDDGKYEENISNMGLVWRWKMLQTFFKLVMFSFLCVSCNCVSYNLMRLRFTTGKIKIRKVN